jgi:hypothetical protein
MAYKRKYSHELGPHTEEARIFRLDVERTAREHQEKAERKYRQFKAREEEIKSKIDGKFGQIRSQLQDQYASGRGLKRNLEDMQRMVSDLDKLKKWYTRDAEAREREIQKKMRQYAHVLAGWAKVRLLKQCSLGRMRLILTQLKVIREEDLRL